MRTRIGKTIAACDEQGIHRTGTDVDVASASWLAGEITAAGATPLEETFEFRRVRVQAAEFRLDELTIEGVPAYDCNYTVEAGVTGRLGELNSDAEIGVVMAPPSDQSEQQQSIVKARRANAHKAILVVTDSALPPSGPALVNAEHFNEPIGPPVLQIADRHWERIQAASKNAEVATLIAQATHDPATAINIGTEIWGEDESLAPVVVMTPRSGWLAVM